MFDPIPRLTIDGQSIWLAEPLSVLQWIWSGLPILLLFIGGAIGGALGAGAFWINTRVFRSEMGGIEKYILTGMISVIAVVLLFVLGLLLGILLEGL